MESGDGFAIAKLNSSGKESWSSCDRLLISCPSPSLHDLLVHLIGWGHDPKATSAPMDLARMQENVSNLWNIQGQKLLNYNFFEMSRSKK